MKLQSRMSILVLAAVTASCSLHGGTARIYIEPQGIEGVTESSSLKVLSQPGTWQTVPASDLAFTVPCGTAAREPAIVSVPIEPGDSWRIAFKQCGVTALKNGQIPHALRAP